MQISNNYKGQDSRRILERLGFEIKTPGNDIAYNVILPEGWEAEDQGPFHTFFNGPDGKQLRSFIKRDPWDRYSFLHSSNISEEEAE